MQAPSALTSGVRATGATAVPCKSGYMTNKSMDNNKKVKKLRRKLHKNPELSGFESNTAKLIRSFVETHHPTRIVEKIGGNGIAVVYQFSTEGPAIAIRCELDALPIEEKNEIPHRSINKGVSHKCGHDGHMAIVAGLVFWTKEQAFKTGKIVLLFQPAEETGKGAFNVIEDEKFTQLGIDYIFALHNIPGQPLHSIITLDNGFSAEVQSFSVHLTGKEAHAAEPEKGINPAITISEVIAEMSALKVTDPGDQDFAVLTPVHVNLGQKSYGISPAKGELHYTIRTWSTERMQLLKSEIISRTKKICLNNNVKCAFNWFEFFPASTNNFACNEIVKEAAKENNLVLIESPHPFKFGEDFGWFSRNFKVAMFGLGAGINTPPLHDENYDFPDELIETGLSMFKVIISKVLKPT